MMIVEFHLKCIHFWPQKQNISLKSTIHLSSHAFSFSILYYYRFLHSNSQNTELRNLSEFWASIMLNQKILTFFNLWLSLCDQKSRSEFNLLGHQTIDYQIYIP